MRERESERDGERVCVCVSVTAHTETNERMAEWKFAELTTANLLVYASHILAPVSDCHTTARMTAYTIYLSAQI